MINEPTSFEAKNLEGETISKETLAYTYTVLKSVESEYSKIGMGNPNGTSSADSMDDITILFEVPKCFKQMKVNASLTVDDWGSLVIDGTEYDDTEEGVYVKPVDIDMLYKEDIAGERGGHSLWTKKVEDIVFKPGKYKITVTHQNVSYSEKYDPQYNDTRCNFNISASPVSHFTKADAQRLLDVYNVVNYHTKTASDVWAYCGGSIYDLHTSNPSSYTDSCALRLSIALGNYGLSLPTQKPSAPYDEAQWYSLSTSGCNNVFGSTSRVVIRARELGNYIQNNLGMGNLHFSSKAAYEEFGKKAGDIVLFYDSDHVGMGTGNDFVMGNYRNEGVWVLYRESTENPEDSTF